MKTKTYQERNPGETCSERLEPNRRCGQLAVDEMYGPMGRWPKCAEHMPREPMTDAEHELIEAAKTLRRNGINERDWERLKTAVDAVEPPAPLALTLRLRARAESLTFECDQPQRALLLEAAEYLERLSR